MKTIKNTTAIFAITAMLFLLSCSSPKNEGERLAKGMNECAENYLKERQIVETEFVNRFNASDYSTRTEALEAYDQALIEVLDAYNACHDDLAIQRSEIAGEYANDYKKMAAFEAAYDNSIDPKINNRLMDAMAEIDYPDAVLAMVRTIIPAKPDEVQIQKDLVGHQLYEGFEKERCWFREDYCWKIGEYEIRNFQIDEVLRDDAKEYVIIASMRLENEINAFDARAKISYVLPEVEDWKIEFVKSMGVTIVKTHKYDDLVSYEIKDDGWGGIDALFITNKSEIELGVGVEVVADGTRKRFAVRVSPNKKSQVGGLFGGGNVTSYRVEFVERF